MKDNKMNFYAIYDKKSQTYSRPFEGYNHDCAKRIVAASMEQDSLLRKYPTDYRLDFLAVFNYNDGSFTPLIEKEIVCEVSNLVPLSCVGDGIRVGSEVREG